MKQAEILFITSTNLSTNPRCYKEIQLAIENGYDASLVAFDLPGWSREFEKKYVETLGIKKFFYISGGRNPFLPWLFASLMEKLSRILYQLNIRTDFIVAMAESKRALLLLRTLKKLKHFPRLIIAHNPAAFYPASKFAKKINSRLGVDIEDYHPGEDNTPLLQHIEKKLMLNSLPAADYVSFAAPLILEETEKIFSQSGKIHESWITINNAFPAADFPEHDNRETDKVSLVWFSQNIGSGRGLEQILPALDKFRTNIELTLIGNTNESFSKQWINHRLYVKKLPPLASGELNRLIGNYDVGLAIESGIDLNRKICLTNKLWVYFQSGIYILSTDTPAQKKFLKDHPGHGISCSPDEQSIIEAIQNIIQDLGSIRSKKNERRLAAKNAGWEHEKNSLLSTWKNLL